MALLLFPVPGARRSSKYKMVPLVDPQKIVIYKSDTIPYQQKPHFLVHMFPFQNTSLNTTERYNAKRLVQIFPE